MLNRFRIILIVVGLFISASAAFADETRAITLWHSFRGEEEKALNAVAVEFNRQNANHIRLERHDGDTFIDDLERAIAGGRGPDIFVWAHDKIGAWVERGIIAPMDRYIDRGSLDIFLPQCVEAMKYRGKIYGLPLSFETIIMFYNKRLVPTPPRTTAEMIEVCRRITNPAEDRWGLVYERGNFYYHAMWLHGFGGRVFDARGRFDASSQAMLRSLKFARDLKAVHNIIPDTVDWNVQMELFNSGRAGIIFSGPWVYGSIDREKIDVGFAPLPYITEAGRPAAPFLGVKGFYVNARSADKAASAKAAEFFASAFSGYIMNTRAAYLPANRFAYELDAIVSDSISVTFKEQAKNAIPMPASPDMTHVWKVMIWDDQLKRPGCLDRVFLDGVSPERATQDAKREFTRLKQGARR